MEKGIIFGDTIIEGILFTLKDGSTEYVKCKEPIVYKTAEENYIKEVADKWRGQITEEVYKALINYKIEITD